MRIAICDDDKNVCSVLKSYIKEYGKETGQALKIHSFQNGKEFLEELKSGFLVDLLFLDIVMEGINGVEIGRYIREELDNYNMKIVYISGNQGYERQLFDSQPIKFLEKPIEKEELFQTLKLARKLLAMNVECFSFKVDYTEKRVRIADILYFESYKRKMIVYTVHGRMEFYGTMKEVEDRLQSYRFVRVQRAYLVNYDYILEINTGYVLLSNQERLRVGDYYRPELHRKMREFERI